MDIYTGRYAEEERAKGEAAAAKLREELEAVTSRLQAAMREGGSLAAAKDQTAAALQESEVRHEGHGAGVRLHGLNGCVDGCVDAAKNRIVSYTHRVNFFLTIALKSSSTS